MSLERLVLAPAYCPRRARATAQWHPEWRHLLGTELLRLARDPVRGAAEAEPQGSHYGSSSGACFALPGTAI